MKKVLVYIMVIFLCLNVTVYVRATILADTNEKNTEQEEKIKEKQRVSNLKKELSSAKTNVKGGKNLEKVESSMRKLLEDSLNRKDLRVHFMLFESIKKQYEQGNEKLFLKQQYDTANIFQLTKKMFYALKDLDSVDALPSEKGSIAPKYRRNHAMMLAQYHGNLYGGGVYFFNHKKYDDAVSFFDTYLSAYKWHLFSNKELAIDSARYYNASYLSLLSLYYREKYDESLRYKEDAVKFTPRLETTLHCLADIYKIKKDTASYVKVLYEGIDSFPESSYFFPRLIDHFSAVAEYDKALDVVDRFVKKDSTNVLYLRVKQTLLLNKCKYNDCIELGKKILCMDDNLPDVNYNIGLAYYNQALDIADRNDLRVRERNRRVNDLYKKCRPYMERYRELEPESVDKWRPVLYNVYLNLNLGKEFTEIENMN